MNYWNYHDLKLKELRKLYERYSRQTRNRLSAIFSEINNLNFNSIYDYADNETIKNINAQIEEWKDNNLIYGYFAVLANKIYGKKYVKYNDIFLLLIYGALIEENSKLENEELAIFKEDVNNYYIVGQKEVNNKNNKNNPIIKLSDYLFLILIQNVSPNGFNWKENKENTIKYNTDTIYKQVAIDIEQKKNLIVNSDTYKTILDRQINSKISINDGKISGQVEQELIALNNQAKLEGIKKQANNNPKVKFISIEDDRRTKMCESLHGQEFYVDKENVFKRYSAINKNYIKYNCNGLITGLNLPPINDHFHYCRSYIIYINDI